MIKLFFYTGILFSGLLMAACAGDDTTEVLKKVDPQNGQAQTKAALSTNVKKVSEEVSRQSNAFLLDKGPRAMSDSLMEILKAQLSDEDLKKTQALAQKIKRLKVDPGTDDMSLEAFTVDEKSWLMITGSLKAPEKASASKEQAVGVLSTQDKLTKLGSKDAKDQKKPISSQLQCLNENCEISIVYIVDQNDFSFAPVLFQKFEVAEVEQKLELGLNEALTNAVAEKLSADKNEFQKLLAQTKEVVSDYAVNVVMDEMIGSLKIVFDNKNKDSVTIDLEEMVAFDGRSDVKALLNP